MKAMILAAGRGERLRPLTDSCPKPLLLAGGQPLMGWHLAKLAALGIHDIVVNHAWLGDQIEQRLNGGIEWGVNIAYSVEGGQALETAGGIATALPLLGHEPFIVINGDVFTDYPIAPLIDIAKQLDGVNRLGHLVLVDNPAHHPQGDFSLTGDLVNDTPGLTFAGIAVYHPAFLTGVAPHQPAKLLPQLLGAMRQGKLSGEHYQGLWIDVGTVERLAEADAIARSWAAV